MLSVAFFRLLEASSSDGLGFQAFPAAVAVRLCFRSCVFECRKYSPRSMHSCCVEFRFCCLAIMCSCHGVPELDLPLLDKFVQVLFWALWSLFGQGSGEL